MRIAVTGASGFLGWHVRCAAFARGVDCVPVGRDEMAEPDRLAAALSGVGAVVHCAGANRGPDAAVTDGNLGPARHLTKAVAQLPGPIRVVYANSVHSREATCYGTAKRQAAELLAGASGGCSDVLLPNLYGEHGRPHHNSFVATFCHEVAAGRDPVVTADREVPLMHAQRAAGILLDEAARSGHRVVTPAGEPVWVSTVLDLLREFDAGYQHGELPDLNTGLRVRLFNTYRSHLGPHGCVVPLQPSTDPRGALVECVRTPVTGGQAFVSSTRPGMVRGDHVHLRKFERFVVVDGDAEIALCRLFTGPVVRLRVSGGQPVAVDMPTMWAHRLSNISDRPVTTFFWTNELYDAGDPDTWPCPVDQAEAPR